MKTPAIGFAIPCLNERDNVPVLLREIADVMGRAGLDYEIVVTDDASTDGTWEVLKGLAAADSRLRIQRFARNQGESAASIAAAQATRAPIVVTIDSDLQNDPADLPKFLAAIENADCVCGSRVVSRARGDNMLKRAISWAANRVRAWVLDDPISDAGCTYRAFRRACLADLPMFDGAHRFIPVVLAWRGFRVVEVPVNNRERRSGKSHYGLFTRIGAIGDMFALRWMKGRLVDLKIAERFPKE